MSFQKLDKTELLRTASEDFAVDVDPAMSKAKIIAALEESGVDFAQYLTVNPEKRALYADIPANVVVESLTPVTPAVLAPEGRRVLIKMVRDNPLFEIGKYRWTQTHPYVAVEEKDADAILIGLHGEGFRQATPGELAEYYS